MRIVRARAYGFCFGVRDALAVARSTPDPDGVTIFGELVHNEQVLHELNVRGFRQVAERPRSLPTQSDRVLITAHGISDATQQQLIAAGKRLIDTTCPLVRRVHAAAQEFAADGRHVIVIGQPGHVEVQGITEDLSSWSVFATPDVVRHTGHPRLGIVCQSTTRPEVAAAVRSRITACQPDADVAFADTICQPTRDRQAAVAELLQEATVLVVVGGLRSNNSRALVEQARQRGVPAHLVQTADDLQAEWFQADDVVGLTAGTSTPDDVIEAVVARLEAIAFHLAPGRPRLGADVDNRVHRTSADWIHHFETRRNTRPELDWSNAATLTADEAAAVGPSIAIFQRGESGQGRHLMRMARRHAAETGDDDYVRALELFVAEENCHADLLRRFLTAAGLPLLAQDWTDGVFRWLRHLAGLELSLSVLVTAEVLAMVYYAALRRATNCDVLRQLCDQVLADEVPHLVFQGQRLGILARGRSPWLKRIVRAAHRGLMCGTMLIVWFTHRAVFHRARLKLATYWRRVWLHWAFLERALASVEASARCVGERTTRRAHASTLASPDGGCTAEMPTTGYGS